MILPKPIWKDVVGYEGLYQVNQLGQVRSLNYNHTRKIKRLRPGTSRGYQNVVLWKDKKKKTFGIHRLVAMAFIPNPNNLPCVNHRDEYPKNNRVENLEWCTYEYNNNYGTKKQRISESSLGKTMSEESKKKSSEAKKGELNPMYGKIGKDSPHSNTVICLTTKRIFFTIKEGAEFYNIKTSGKIGMCCRKERNYCGKYKGEKLVWRYLNWKHNKRYRVKKYIEN